MDVSSVIKLGGSLLDLPELPGRLANFVVVAADPLEQIGNLRTILFTVKRGRRYDRSEFRPISSREIPDDE